MRARTYAPAPAAPSASAAASAAAAMQDAAPAIAAAGTIARPATQTARGPKRAATGKMALLAPERALEVADDLAHFFGRNADVYLATYTKMVEDRNLIVIGWHWPLFLTYTIWVFYRRLWIAGVVLAVLPFALQFLGSGAIPAGFGLVLSLSVIAKSLYVNEGLKQILAADEMNLTGPQRMTWLMRKGGVSTAAAILAIVFYVVLGTIAATTAVTELLAQRAEGEADAAAPDSSGGFIPRSAEESVPR
jgi:hypothetical protein